MSHRIFGAELSPYSVKVRSYFRYKGIPHQWVVRSAANMEEFQRHAKLPLIPLVLTPDGRALQDSTPILEHFERTHPEPTLSPADAALRFVSALIEEYGDEWGNKAMFHYRWYYAPDQASAAARLAHDNLPGADEATVDDLAAAVRARMVPRLSFVGSSPETKDTIEASFLGQLAILEAHLATRPYLLGGRPAFADFGLAPQLYQCLTDPTPGALIRARAPRVRAWIERMLTPTAHGDFEAWEALAPTLTPLLRDEIGALFLPWSTANATAIARGDQTFTVTLAGRPWTQEAQRYHAKSLAALRAKYAELPDRARLDPILAATGCAAALAG